VARRSAVLAHGAGLVSLTDRLQIVPNTEVAYSLMPQSSDGLRRATVEGALLDGWASPMPQPSQG